MAVNKKAVGRTRGAATKAPAKTSSNPFEKGTPSHAVAALMLRSGEHSWEELTEAAGGTLSTRTMGGVIRGLEAAGFRFTKHRDPEYGTVYKMDKTGKAATLANTAGPDATGNHKKPAPVKKAAASATPARKASVTKKAAGAKKAAPKPTAGRTRASAATKTAAAKTTRPAAKVTKTTKVARRVRGRAGKK